MSKGKVMPGLFHAASQNPPENKIMGKTPFANKHKVWNSAKRKPVDKISQDFADNVRKELGHHVKKIILFGSHARGDFTEGSDYDFLIVLDERTKTYEKVLLEIGVDFLNKYDVLIGDIIYAEKEWELRKRFPLGLNVMKEGIEL